MAVTFTTDKTAYGYLETVTFTFTGGSPSTAYQAVVTTAGGHVQTYNFTTDGSGNATWQDVSQERGSYSAVVNATAPSQVATLTFADGG